VATAVVWFRRDLRLGDNPAWSAGTGESQVCPLFVIDPQIYDRVSERRRVWLTTALHNLDHDLRARGGRLRVEVGEPRAVVPLVCSEMGASAVHINNEVTPYGVVRDRDVAGMVPLVGHHGVYLHAPGTILTQDEQPYRVFTPFHRAWGNRPIELVDPPGSARLTSDPGKGLPSVETPAPETGESIAKGQLSAFLRRVDTYPTSRDRPDLDATSRLSIALKYGTIGPRTILEAVGTSTEGRLAFIRQLAWRDFYGHLMAMRPDTVNASMRPEYREIEWRNDPEEIDAWERGMTGYPIIDAGMRQLATEGWIHNRVRMLIASFLVKDLLVDWRVGERYLRRHLLDADVAQNVGNWQWVAGTGTDAAPYFRVFNPVTQSRRFDPDGVFIRRHVPELEGVRPADIHAPWESPPLELAASGVVLGVDYPFPIVDHASARLEAIAAYERRS